MSDPCKCCFIDYLAKCEEDIVLNITLPPYDTYKWIITDKFGNKYEGELSEDQTIPVTELPAGLLTQYSGEFKLEIFTEDDNYCEPVEFEVAGNNEGYFNCITFTIKGGNFVKNNLGCEV